MSTQRMIVTADRFCKELINHGNARCFGKYIVSEEIHISKHTFSHDVYIGEAIFEKLVYFNGCTFQGKFISENTTFSDGVVFSASMFIDAVNFSKSKVSAFGVDDCIFCKMFFCTNTLCSSDFSACGAKFYDALIVQASIFKGDFILDQSTIQKFDCIDANFNNFSCYSTVFKTSIFPLGTKFTGDINVAGNYSIGMTIYFQQQNITFDSDDFKKSNN